MKEFSGVHLCGAAMAWLLGMSFLVVGGCAMTRIPPPRASAPPTSVASPAKIEAMLQEMMGKGGAGRSDASGDIQVAVQSGHAARITCVAVSSDGRYVLSGAFDETAKLWDAARGQEVRTLYGIGLFGPLAVGFGGNGSTLLIDDGFSITAYSAVTGAKLRQFGKPLWGSTAGSLALEGEGDGKSLRLVDIDSGDTRASVALMAGEKPLAFSADGTTLLTGSPGQRSHLQVWDIPTQSRRRIVAMQWSPNTGAGAVSKDGRWLVLRSAPETLTLVDLHNGHVVRTLSVPSAGAGALTTTLRFDATGERLAWASTSNEARIFDLRGDRPPLSLVATAVDFGADGHTLVLGRVDGGAPSFFDIVTAAETPLSSGADGIHDLAVTAEGRSIAVAAGSGGVKLWDVASARLLRTFHCPLGAPASSVAVGGLVPKLAVGCLGGATTVFDLETGQTLKSQQPVLGTGDLTVAHVLLSGDGRQLIAGMGETFAVWNLETGEEVLRRALPAAIEPRAEARTTGSGIIALALHPQGRLIAVARQNDLTLWDISSGQLVRDFGKTDAKHSALPSPSGLGARLSAYGGAAGWGGSKSSNPLDLMIAPTRGILGVEFTADGKYLVSVGMGGHRIWEIATGQDMTPMRTADAGGGLDAQLFKSVLEPVLTNSKGIALSSDGQRIARGRGRLVEIMDLATGMPVKTLRGHTSDVEAAGFLDAGNLLATAGRDGTVRIWNVAAGQEIVALISLGEQDSLALTPDGYYQSSKSSLKNVGFRIKDELYPFEQFDLHFNRPDVVLQRLGLASPTLIHSYRNAYQHRLKKMGFKDTGAVNELHLPAVQVLNQDEIPATTDRPSLALKVRGRDDQYALDRFNVYVNDVPIYGTAGLPVSSTGTHLEERELQLPLVAGRDKLQVSVLNVAGVESLRKTVYTRSTAAVAPAEVYVLSIGVSRYRNPAYALRFAAKDARDIAAIYEANLKHPPALEPVHTLSLTDERATRDQIRNAKAWLLQSRPQDLVVVFAAGHGMIGADSNYYFGTYDIDPEQPQAAGLPYEEIEGLLDGLPALRKVLLLDTCFSGELDQQAPTVIAGQSGDRAAGAVTMRTFRTARNLTAQATPNANAPPDLVPDVLQFQQSWFADLRRGTGAAVISSSAGSEYSLEGEQWRNGVFTYAILRGLKSGEADRNADGTITVSELEAYVAETVRALTGEAQHPTLRHENLEYDFAVY